MKKITFCFLVSFFVTTFPSISGAAQSGQSFFGGMAVMEITCTCSAYTYFYFTPLYLNSGNSSSGALALSDAGVMYSNYYLTAGGWALGHYTQGGGACMMEAGEDCIELSTQGTITQQTGTSL